MFNSRPVARPEDDDEPRPKSPEEKLYDWKVEQLVTAGMSMEHAETLALRRDDSWRVAMRALERGCDAALAYKIAS